MSFGRRALHALTRITRGPTRSGSPVLHPAPPPIPERPSQDRSSIFAPPGHFYSPIPSQADIDAVARRTGADELRGIDLREPAQLALLDELALFYRDLPFAPTAAPGLRYRFENPSYSYADGIFLYSMLRHLKPRRVIEVGSGFTSALLLDTNERFLDNRVECTFIEPYPQLLLSLLS